MAGNARLESPSASSSELAFAGTYSNGQRGVHSIAMGPNLDRPGSFREGGESRMFGSGVAVSRGGSSAVVGAGELPPLSQCLSLEPIVMGEQKIMRSGELRRVMGVSVGSTTEDNSVGVAASHLKPSPPVAVVEDLKRYRSSVLDTCIKARGRVKKLDGHLHKLDKYCEAVSSKKLQRNELTTNDRAGALNLKMGSQIYRNPSELVNQRVEDRPKNVLLNKRVRTSMAETRAECRSNGLQRQSVPLAKDRDLLKDNGGESDLFEEKIRRLPAGGEGWDKKMKRKRSVGMGFPRPNDSDGEPKRAVQNKAASEPGSQANDVHAYRLGASNGTGGCNKLDTASLPNSSSARPSPKNEQEGSSLPRDLTAGSNKERILAKGSNRLNNRDDNYTTCPSPVTKGKASRAPRTGSMVAASLSPNIPRASGTPEIWENAMGANKIPLTGGASNRKRAMPSGSSSPPMAQWVGQRPQKMSRTRRSNLVSPVSNQDEKQLSSDSCSPSDIGVRLASNGNNGSLISRNVANGSQQFKVKLENVQSPLRLSESEESVGAENRLKDKGMGNGEVDANAVQNVGPSVTLAKKNKPLVNEESGDGVRRQGRSGRGPLIARASISSTGEKLDNVATPKPHRSNRLACEKNGSKSGRPLKRLSDRKGFSRLGHLHNSGSPDCTGESDEDRDELSIAANHARNASYVACSSTFWKKMEPIFACVGSEDKFYLSRKLKSGLEIQETFPQFLGSGNAFVMDLLQEDTSVLGTVTSVEKNGHVQCHESEPFFGTLDSETSSEFIPLYQRVLSALVIEDNIDELEEEDAGNVRLQDPFAYDAYLLNDTDPRKRVRMEIERDSGDTKFGAHVQGLHSVKKSFSGNGVTNTFRSFTLNNSACEDVDSDVELLAGISKNFLNGPQVLQLGAHGVSSFDCQYELMCLDDKLLLELQSIGLYPETVPALDDKEDEAIKREIDQLKIRLQQQIGKKKAYLEKICNGVESSTGDRDLRQVAMDRLLELAYRKLLATRGTSKAGIPKVPKHVALAFGRRTLARCRKFENSGSSCFNEPQLRDILLAPREKEPEPTVSVGRPVSNSKYLGSRNHQPDSRLSSGVYPRSLDGVSSNMYGTFNHLSDEAFAINGPISNRGKKKELLLDDVVGTAAIRAGSSHLGNTILGGTKGKRSERDVAKGGRASQGNSKGERKTKAKPKQRTGQLPISGNGFVNKFTGSTHPTQPSANGSSQLAENASNRKKDIRSLSQGNNYVHQDTSKEKDGMDRANSSLHDFDPIEELGVGTDLGGPQDLSSLLNFDEEDLQDHYSAGLDIPMDDLSELNMF